MSRETLNIIFLLSPLALGGIIAAINTDAINTTTEKAESWIRKSQLKVSSKQNWLSRYIANPVLWIVVKFSDWTDGFSHRGLKNGLRFSATLYLLAVWCLILYTAFLLFLFLLIAFVILLVVFKVLGSSNEEVKSGYAQGRTIAGRVGSGQRVNQETGVIQEEGIFGWNDTDQRIDPESGTVQKQGIFGWNDTETKIDQKTGNIQKEGLFGYNDTNTRINPETGIIQKNGILGWQDTDERINPETGRHQKNGFFGWSDD